MSPRRTPTGGVGSNQYQTVGTSAATPAPDRIARFAAPGVPRADNASDDPVAAANAREADLAERCAQHGLDRPDIVNLAFALGRLEPALNDAELSEACRVYELTIRYQELAGDEFEAAGHASRHISSQRAGDHNRSPWPDALATHCEAEGFYAADATALTAELTHLRPLVTDTELDAVFAHYRTDAGDREERAREATSRLLAARDAHG